MKVVVVGLGRIGTLHARYAADDGHSVMTVDNGGVVTDSQSVDTIETPGDVDTWIVATPTSTHYSVVNAILRSAPRARVIVEKPAVAACELERLQDLVDVYPDCRIAVNDVYQYSPAVRRFAETVHRRQRTDRLLGIEIELVKNRVVDERRGRFVDHDYGKYGYEHFHALSILRWLLDADMYTAYLQEGIASGADVVDQSRTRDPDPAIVIHTDVTGLIRNPTPGLATALRRPVGTMLRNRRIPVESDFRYRYASTRWLSGARIDLVFECLYRLHGNYKNVHGLREIADGTVDEKLLHGNHFRVATREQIRALHGETFDRLAHLRIAEHRHLRSLSRAHSRQRSRTVEGARVP